MYERSRTYSSSSRVCSGISVKFRCVNAMRTSGGRYKYIHKMRRSGTRVGAKTICLLYSTCVESWIFGVRLPVRSSNEGGTRLVYRDLLRLPGLRNSYCGERTTERLRLEPDVVRACASAISRSDPGSRTNILRTLLQMPRLPLSWATSGSSRGPMRPLPLLMDYAEQKCRIRTMLHALR